MSNDYGRNQPVCFSILEQSKLVIAILVDCKDYSAM